MATIRLAVFPALAALALAAPLAQQRSIDDFFTEFSAAWVRTNPNTAVATRWFGGDEQAHLERQLTPLTRVWQEARYRLAERGLRELRTFDRSRMNEQQRTAAELLDWILDATLQGEPFDQYVFPLEQMQGANVTLPNALTVVHPLRTVADGQNYVARLGQVAARMDEAVAESRRQAADGVLPPGFILRATIAQMRQFVTPPPEGNPFVTALLDRLQGVSAIPPDRRRMLAAEAARIVESQVYPAWHRAIAALEEQATVATEHAGLWRLPRGAAAYAYFLRRYTTTDLTADQIHEIGLREVARLEREMDVLLRKIGRSDGTIVERVAQLRRDLRYPAGEASRTTIMADVERMMRDAERRAAEQFALRPRAAVTAQPYPRFREANAAASYSAPPLDGSRSGVFQIPLRPERMTTFALRSLVHHETVPGHHFQIAIDLEDEAQPRWRRVRLFGGIPASTEGWALYAERIAVEAGWYEGDVEGLIGALDSELFRARRLVVDTGLHAKRWTREQAIAYGIEASEVERYVVYPGQATSYMVGQLRLLELRDKARAALGDRFSIRDFHTAVLRAGVLPLHMLERQVDAYITRVSDSGR
jgi:uncharacterized protein (DUF885 family)